MRWTLLLILCVMLIGGNGCTRVDAAPAPVGTPPKEITTEALVGYMVVSTDGTEIGPVDGVVLNVETGKTEYVVVFLKDIYNFGRGAAHGPQNHYLPIPWSHLKVTATKQLLIDMDGAFVDDAPVFNEPPDTSIVGWDSAVEGYWTE